MDPKEGAEKLKEKFRSRGEMKIRSGVFSRQGQVPGVAGQFDVAVPARRMIATYLQRRQIETFYQDGKEHLGFNEYRMRDAKAIQKQGVWCS